MTKHDVDRLLEEAKALMQKIALTENQTSASYDQVLQRFREYSEPVLQEQVGLALLKKGQLIRAKDAPDTFEEERACYDQIIRQYKTSNESSLQELVAEAFDNKAISFSQQAQWDDVVNAYDEMACYLSTFTNFSLQDKWCYALYQQAKLFSALDVQEKELACYDQIIARFRAANDAELQQKLLAALWNKAASLSSYLIDSGDWFSVALDSQRKTLIGVYEEIISRFKNSSETDILDLVAKAIASIKLFTPASNQ